MPSTRGKKKSEYEKQLEKTRKAVQKVKDTKYKAQLEKTGKAVKKVKDTKAVVKQVKKVKKAVQKVKDTKYKAQLEKTRKAVQKVKDTKYKAQLEKTRKAVQKVKDTNMALDKAIDKKRKAQKVGMPRAITEKPKKKAAPKKLVSDEKMDRMKRKVAILNRKKVAERKVKGFKTQNTAKKLKAIDALPDVDPEAEMEAQFGKAKAKPKKKAAPKKDKFLEANRKAGKSAARGGIIVDGDTDEFKKAPRKFVEKASTSKDLSKIKAKPDVMGGLFNAAHITLGNLIEKQFKDMNAEIKKYKTADAGYFEKVSKGGVSQYHTMGGDALIVHQKLVEKQFGKAIALAPGGMGNPKIQALIRTYNKRGKSGMTRARKAKYEAEQRLGL